MIKKLHVGGLSERITDSVLRQRFEAFGIVQSAQVIRDHETGRSKGFGIVEMASDEEARDAIAGLNGKSMDGRMLTVKEAKFENRTRGGSGRSNIRRNVALHFS